jgi:GNAT superfamily N-acetyltransferase
MAPVEIREGGAIPEKQVRELFDALGWSHYNDLLPDLLLNSTYVVSAWDEARLVGLARVVSDRVYISMLHQVGVHPAYQRQGLGTELVRRCVERFGQTHILLTTDDPSNETFYARFGFVTAPNAMCRPAEPDTQP